MSKSYREGGALVVLLLLCTDVRPGISRLQPGAGRRFHFSFGSNLCLDRSVKVYSSQACWLCPIGCLATPFAINGITSCHMPGAPICPICQYLAYWSTWHMACRHVVYAKWGVWTISGTYVIGLRRLDIVWAFQIGVRSKTNLLTICLLDSLVKCAKSADSSARSSQELNTNLKPFSSTVWPVEWESSRRYIVHRNAAFWWPLL